MKLISTDPTVIRFHGDEVEKHWADRILNAVPSYAYLWVTYIGNDGMQNYLPMLDAEVSVCERRVKMWEQLYTMFESLALCWEIEKQVKNREQIQDMSDYLWNLNAWMAFHAHLGRIRDTAKRVAEQIDTPDLFKCLESFYAQRHIVLHGIKVPMRWVENVICFPPLSEGPGHWHKKMTWAELKADDFNFISGCLTNTLYELEKEVESFLSQVRNLAPSRLGLLPVKWPESVKSGPICQIVTECVVGPKPPLLVSGTLNIPG